MKKDLFTIGVPFIGGGVVFLLLVFGTGLVTTTSSAQYNVAMARIDERASTCFDAASAYLTKQGSEAPIVAGMSGRQQRDALAQEFLIATGDTKFDFLVRDECSKRLDA